MNGQPKKIAALYLGLVFAAGLVLGAAAHRFHAVQTADARVVTPVKKSSSQYRKELIATLRMELSLSPEQVKDVNEIYDEIGKQYHAVRKTIDPQVNALRAQRAERIMALLDDEQKVKYQEILDERARKRAGKGCN